jgi:peptidase E
MIQQFIIQAELNVIQMEHNLGELKELVFTCDKETANKIISEAVKRGMPFERTSTGVNIYN